MPACQYMTLGPAKHRKGAIFRRKMSGFIKWRFQFKIMIQKINDNNYTVYTKQKTLNVPDTGEKFNLNYTQNGTSPETKDKDKVSDSKGPHAAEQSGVRLELSSEGRNADAHRQSPEEPAKAQSAPEHKPLFETIRSYIVSAIKAVQKFFHDIWYAQPPEPSDAMSQEPLLITGQEILPDDMADASAENSPDVIPDTPLEDSPVDSSSDMADVSMEDLPDHMADASANGLPYDMADASMNGLPGDMADAPANGLPGDMADLSLDDFLEVMAGISQDNLPGNMTDASQNSLTNAVKSASRGSLTNALKGSSRKISPKTARNVTDVTDISHKEGTPAAREAQRERMILQLLSEGKREQAVNLLTENGKRTVAKNTTLLTSYDKNGRVVEASASDRERTLHGDRNTWKL